MVNLSKVRSKNKIAANENTPLAILEQMSKDEDWKVRLTVTENNRTPAAVLYQMSKDKDRFIRRAVAKSLKKRHKKITNQE